MSHSHPHTHSRIHGRSRSHGRSLSDCDRDRHDRRRGSPRHRLCPGRDAAGACRAVPQAGFTLVEMMAAIGILTFGLTALLGVLSVGVATRQSAEQNERAVVLVGQALKRAEEHVHEHAAVAGNDGTIPDLVVDQVPGAPGLGYRMTFTVLEPERDVALARLHVRWLEGGEAAEVVFDHVLPVQELFSERVRQRLGRTGGG